MTGAATTPALGIGAALTRLLALAGVACGLLVLTAGPALAHGSTPDASNFASRVTGVAAMVDGKPADATRMPAGVSFRVLGADALLQVRNTGTQDVTVTGYNGEPYLRVGPDGTFENRRSPATYLNTDRFAQAEVPPSADAKAAPQWRRLSDAPQWAWHDHRIHWMSQESPPQVQEDAGTVHNVLSWYVPFQAGDATLAVQGVLEWIPPGPVWPWLVGTAVVLTLVVVGAAVAGPHAAVRATVVVLTVVAVASGVVAVGDVLATPAGFGADAWAVVQTLVPAAVAVALAWSLWRPRADEPAPLSSLVIAAAILAISGGFVRLTELRSSQVVNVLPAWSVRAIIAAALTVLVPALLVLLTPDRSATAEPSEQPA